MQVGYVRGATPTRQIELLEKFGIEELFIDELGYNIFAEVDSQYQEMLNYLEPEDRVIISSLEVLSRNYDQLLDCLDRFEEKGVTLEVLNFPELTNEEMQEVIQWSLKNERILYPRLIKLGKEQGRNQNHYSIFSKDPEGKSLYRKVVKELVNREKLKKIADRNGIPLETVYRINQEVERIKLAIVLVLCFLLAIFGIKLAETFSDNIIIQVAVCVIATLVILYNTLIDSREW